MSNSKYLGSAGTQKIVNKINENKETVDRHISTNMYDTEVHGLWYDDANKSLNIKNPETGEVVTLAYSGSGGGTHSGKVMTVNIDLSNSNPETAVTYADDAVGMTPGSDEWDAFFGHYPCLFKDGAEVGKLNRNNFDQFEDGSAADISSGDAGDAMIAFPRRGLKISTIGNVLTISMTDNPDNPEFKYYAHERGETRKEVFYLSAYNGYEMGNRLRSLKGKYPTGERSLYSFREFARANGTGYDVNGFYQLTFLQTMYLLKYKNRDSQTAIGRGYVDGNSKKIATGGTETNGMDWGETTGKQHMKLFGIEDFWGNSQKWIEGVCSDSEGHILIANDNFNDSGTGYKVYEKGGYTSDYMYKPEGTTELGFIGQKYGASQTTYFCDFTAFTYSSDAAYFGGAYSDGSNAGIFTLQIGKPGYNGDFMGARLMYL